MSECPNCSKTLPDEDEVDPLSEDLPVHAHTPVAESLASKLIVG